MKAILPWGVLALLLAGCTPSPPQMPPPPDWVELNDRRIFGEVSTTAQEQRQLFSAPEYGIFRLWVYESPGVKQLTLGKGKWDVAFMDIGGRAIDVYPHASCSAPPCPILSSRFPAASVLVAKAGTFETTPFERFGQMRWGEPVKDALRKPQVIPLPDTDPVETTPLP